MYKDVDEQRNNTTIVGHYQCLEDVCLDQGTIDLNKATIDWFLLQKKNKTKWCASW